MQRQGTDVRQSIFPRHVSQLQCIIDAFPASRGWLRSVLEGHCLFVPPAGFRQRREVDLFLDRENEKQPQKFLQSVDILRQFLRKDEVLNSYVGRHSGMSELLQGIQEDFINWLGVPSTPMD